MSIASLMTAFLREIGENPDRGGLIETPARVEKAWRTWTCGYNQKPAQILKDFEDGAEKYDEMILVRDISFYSHCEHHLAPFFGVAHIAYIPNGKIVGLSKLARLTDVFARRLQVQERLTAQIADALMEHLDAKGAAVQIVARHLCMESRGVQKQNNKTITTVLRGVFMDPAARSEFLHGVK
jgi:GTP cyclohydrolase I